MEGNQTAQQPQDLNPEKIQSDKSNKKLFVIITIVIFSILVGTGLVYGYFKFIKITNNENGIVNIENKISSDNAPNKTFNLATMRLAKIPEGYFFSEGFSIDEPFHFDTQGNWTSFLVKNDNEEVKTVVGYSDGRQLEFDNIAIVNPNGTKIANLTEDLGSNGDLIILHDYYNNTEVKSKIYDSISQIKFFGENGHRLVFTAKKENKNYVVIDGIEYGPYDQLYKGGRLFFSDKGSRIAFIEEENNTFFVIIENIKEGPYNSIKDNIKFSPDGKRIAYVADGKAVIDGVKNENYNITNTVVSKLTFSPDSTKVAIVAVNNNDLFFPKSFVYVFDGKKIIKYKEGNGDILNLRFSNDSKQIAYIVDKTISYPYQSEEFVMVGNVKHKTYDRITSLDFNTTGELFYEALENGQYFLVIDNAEQIRHESELLPIISGPHGNLFYVIGGSIPIIDAVPQNNPLEFIPSAEFFFKARFGDKISKSYDSVYSLRPAFSNDGTKVAFIVNELRKEFVVVGDYEGAQYDAIISDMIFSNDDTKLAYATLIGNEIWWIVDDISNVEFSSWETAPINDIPVVEVNPSCDLNDKPKGDPTSLKYNRNFETNSNLIQFKLEFIGCLESKGLVTVYIDDKKIGSIDEDQTMRGEQYYSFLFEEILPGTHQIEFRLDGLNKDVKSVMRLENVRFALK